MSIFAEGMNGLRCSDMELEAIMDQCHRTGTLWCCRREILSMYVYLGLRAHQHLRSWAHVMK